jgi:hypothetical protein
MNQTLHQLPLEPLQVSNLTNNQETLKQNNKPLNLSIPRLVAQTRGAWDKYNKNQLKKLIINF